MNKSRAYNGILPTPRASSKGSKGPKASKSSNIGCLSSTCLHWRGEKGATGQCMGTVTQERIEICKELRDGYPPHRLVDSFSIIRWLYGPICVCIGSRHTYRWRPQLYQIGHLGCSVFMWNVHRFIRWDNSTRKFFYFFLFFLFLENIKKN